MVVIEINNLGLIHLRMMGVNCVSMKNDQLMGVCFKTMLVLLITVIMPHIQMCMRWRPLERHKGGKQKKNKRCFGTLLDHEGIELKVVSGFVTPMMDRVLGIVVTTICHHQSLNATQNILIALLQPDPRRPPLALYRPPTSNGMRLHVLLLTWQSSRWNKSHDLYRARQKSDPSASD